MSKLKANWLSSMVLAGTAFLAALTPSYAGSTADVPDQIRPPANEALVLNLHADGVQIYICQQGAEGKSLWSLKAPDAQLHDATGAVVAHHSAGPSWKHRDGSEVTGKVAAKVDSPDHESIPWLLVTATGHTGAGVMARVASIQRTNTEGGLAPAATLCDGSKPGSEAAIPYRADYKFYAPVK